jgi:hypothetical protein
MHTRSPQRGRGQLQQMTMSTSPPRALPTNLKLPVIPMLRPDNFAPIQKGGAKADHVAVWSTPVIKSLNLGALGTFSGTALSSSRKPNAPVDSQQSIGGLTARMNSTGGGTSRRNEGATAGKVLVTVAGAEDLPRADRTSSDPYVKPWTCPEAATGTDWNIGAAPARRYCKGYTDDNRLFSCLQPRWQVLHIDSDTAGRCDLVVQD